jgi:hypothetical protein
LPSGACGDDESGLQGFTVSGLHDSELRGFRRVVKVLGSMVLGSRVAVMRTVRSLLTVMLAATSSVAGAQPATQNVEVEPVTCWWRSSASSVRVGQPFSVVLTCSALETEAAKAVIDRGRLASAAVQLPPYEVTGGIQADDIVTASRRFVQYEYTLRLLGDDVFGADVPIPALQVSYSIESRVQQDAAVQGREQTYVLPALPVHVASLVPATETHIREAPVATMSAIAARQTRGALLRTVGTITFVVAGLLLLVTIARAVQQRRSAVTRVRRRLVGDSAVLAGVKRELREVGQQAARDGWSEALAARALAALRVTGSYAAGQPVTQRPLNGAVAADGSLVLRRPLGGRVLVSAAATSAVVPQNGAVSEDLRSAMADLTTARYGRAAKQLDLHDAIERGLRATAQVASEHTWYRQSLARLRSGAASWRERAWRR